MPEIKIKHIVSCSSEDKNNPAENLLRPEGTHKWKCATAGLNQISVVLEFDKASQVHSVDIGNEGSSFVEILVGRSTAPSDQDYKVLLVASTFMNPRESRSGTNRNGVRMFGLDKLNKTVASEKWDRAKVVCVQPFNKTSTFGLSFIKFHSTPDSSDKEAPQKKLGFFKMKEDAEEPLNTGSLFSHRNKTPPKPEPPVPVTGAAAVRAASRLAEESRLSAGPSGEPSPSTASTSKESKPAPSRTASEKKRESPVPMVTKKSEVKKETKATPTPSPSQKRKYSGSSDEEDPVPKSSLRKQATSFSSSASSENSHRSDVPPLKKTKSLPAKESPVKAFSQLMKKVVFVMSGFQNPYRAELRDKATEMGATYKPDWGKSCTHLICAFSNTPKFQQVEGKGRIVKKNWILDCHKQKKLLPWRPYRLANADSPSETSDDDDDDDESWKPSKKTVSKSPKKQGSVVKEKPETPKKKASYKDEEEEDVYGGDTDSGEDTEEEVNRVKAAIAKASPVKGSKAVSPAKGDKQDDPYGASTDEDEDKVDKKSKSLSKPQPVAMETDDGSDSGVPDLPDFFTDKHFFFYGSMTAADRRLLTRYVAAYDGEIEEYMNDKVNYVVTSSKWDKNFDDALADNPDLIFVKPKWVHLCHEKTKLVPHQPYIVVPD